MYAYGRKAPTYIQETHATIEVRHVFAELVT